MSFLRTNEELFNDTNIDILEKTINEHCHVLIATTGSKRRTIVELLIAAVR